MNYVDVSIRLMDHIISDAYNKYVTCNKVMPWRPRGDGVSFARPDEAPPASWGRIYT